VDGATSLALDTTVPGYDLEWAVDASTFTAFELVDALTEIEYATGIITIANPLPLPQVTHPR